MKKARLLLDAARDGFWNMAADESLFENAADIPYAATLRLYGWHPHTLSLGRRQKESDANLEDCRKRGIDVVRRFGGGAAVYHGEEITYCFTARLDMMPLPDPSAWRKIFSRFLASLGLEADREEDASPEKKTASACFALAERDEPTICGKKWVGSARRKSRKVFLQHGSILLERQPEFAGGLMRKPVGDASIGLKNILPSLDEAAAKDTFVKSIETTLDLRFEKEAYTIEENKSINLKLSRMCVPSLAPGD